MRLSVTNTRAVIGSITVSDCIRQRDWVVHFTGLYGLCDIQALNATSNEYRSAIGRLESEIVDNQLLLG